MYAGELIEFSLYVPTHDEKTFVLLAYVLGFSPASSLPSYFFWPSAIQSLWRSTRLQSLVWRIIFFAFFFGGMIVVFILIFAITGF